MRSVNHLHTKWFHQTLTVVIFKWFYSYYFEGRFSSSWIWVWTFPLYLLLHWKSVHPDVLCVVCRELKEILGFRNYQTCMKEAALLDYYVCGFWWAKEANFTPIQISFTMAVLHMLLNNIRGGEDTQRRRTVIHSCHFSKQTLPNYTPSYLSRS